MLCNYHGHTSRCKHAAGKDEDYVLEAIKNGFDEIGFSDHSPWPLDEDENDNMRMKLSELDAYIQSVCSLREKYKDQIKIYLALECEYLEDRMDWLKQIKKEKGFDYFIFGNHFDGHLLNRLYFGRYQEKEHCLKRYKESVIKGISTGEYIYLAHPDLFIKTFGFWQREFEGPCLEILRTCKELDLPIEYNLAGLVYGGGYPCDEFWKLAAKVGNKAIIGIDAHSPEDYRSVELINQSREKLENMGLTVLDHLEL